MNDLLATIWTMALALLGIFVVIFLIGLTSLTVAMFLKAVQDMRGKKDDEEED